MSIYYHGPRATDTTLSRRQLLHRCGMGMGAMALANLMAQAGLASTPEITGSSAPLNPLSPKLPQFPGKAKRVIHLFMNGGPSQVDTFDPKPSLEKFAGKSLPGEFLPTERRTGGALASPFKFKKYGKAGIDISDLFPHVAESA